jgi:signal transduction histidine kinase
LYWRIALGMIVLLTAVLAVEAIVFAWIVARTPQARPPRALQQAARALALELESSLVHDPTLDLEHFVRDRVSAISRPVLLVWRDGRLFYAGMDEVPESLIQVARARLDLGRGTGLNDGASGGRGTSQLFDSFRTRRSGFATVDANGVVSGVIMVLAGPPLRTVLRELGPMLFAVAAVLTIGGTAIAALLIFGPTQRRLSGLETAARRLGAGETSARAPETGGDEIAGVARSFNAMASEIVRRAEALQAADRARRQLLADVSHELMTPLTAMRGYLETLKLPGLTLDDASRERYLAIVLEETLRLERMIGDLLDLARLEAGGAAFSMRDVHVADLFERVRSRHERSLVEKRVALETSIARGAEQLEGDGDRLEQALQNLAANALRHTPAGGKVVLAAEPGVNGDIRIAVADTGQGIPSEHLPFVFDRFYKADTARAGTGSGSGLGLSIVRAIAERHGGRVRAESTPNVQTVFELILPRVQPSPRAAAS